MWKCCVWESTVRLTCLLKRSMWTECQCWSSSRLPTVTATRLLNLCLLSSAEAQRKNKQAALSSPPLPGRRRRCVWGQRGSAVKKAAWTMRYQANGKKSSWQNFFFPLKFQNTDLLFCTSWKSSLQGGNGRKKKKQPLVHRKGKEHLPKVVFQWLSQINLHLHVRGEAKLRPT